MRKAAFLIVAVAVFALMAGAVAVRELLREPEQAFAGGGVQPVEVADVTTATFADTIEAIGTARANEQVTISAQVSEIIGRIAFESGDRVTAGQILVEQAGGEEYAALNEARATEREARQEQERFRDLAERGIAPTQRVQETQAALDRATARVRAVEARLANRIIRAPFDGVVGLRNVSAGELVGPGDIIATLDDVSRIKLDFTVPERFLSVVSAGQVIVARSDAFQGETFDGEITNVDSRVDPVTRAVTVRAEIDNSDGRLLPGMLLTIEVRRDVRERPAIPETAVMRRNEQAFVYVVPTGDNPVIEARNVDLGVRSGAMIEVVSGLQPGERVVSEGTHRLRPGAPVQVTRQWHSTGATAVGTAP
ncbi:MULTISPECIES: efflux RND transporter periplasmic adaptor subunit [Hyphobacterium]|uniref:Efflux RND transporter periplasmic adaptor subunit n=1 Tax=Hyphobacterium vulgare TaxID=1736751 RepID=A0ABV6ZU82_9PROT